MTGRTLVDLGSAGAGERREGAGGRNSKFEMRKLEFGEGVEKILDV
jgi:hypothetical protein